MNRTTHLGSLGPVCPLGLATRGEGQLSAADVRLAIDRGINYLNWCGHPDGLSRAVRELGAKRESVVVAVQLESVTAVEAASELDGLLAQLGTEYVDVVTYYYVERAHEWEAIIGPGGALEQMLRARAAGRVRLLGVTSHQRPLAAQMAQSGLLDLLMIRYNAAHRGAESDIFPITDRIGMPVIAYTCLRWGALLQPTSEDLPHCAPPTAPDCYRFVLQSPSVAVALMAPRNRKELDEDLSLLDRWEPLTESDTAALVAHGDRVYRTAASFP